MRFVIITSIAALAIILSASCAASSNLKSRANGAASQPSSPEGASRSANDENADSDRELRSLSYTDSGDAYKRSTTDDSGAEEDSEAEISGQGSQLGPSESDADDDGSGQLLVPGEGLVPRDWPEGITLMPDFDVKYGASDSEGQKIVAMGNSTVEEVRAYYKKLDGWSPADDLEAVKEIDEETGGEITRLIVILNRNADVLTIEIVEKPDETIIQMLYTGG